MSAAWCIWATTGRRIPQQCLHAEPARQPTEPDTLEFDGSTYVAKHAPDFFFANDPWFRGLVIKYGPDGGVYFSDWTDTGECHNYEVADTTNGRIYKWAWRAEEGGAFDLEKQTWNWKLQWHENDWYVGHARRLLQERRNLRISRKTKIKANLLPKVEPGRSMRFRPSMANTALQ
jgi:hypothetical protein